MLAGGGEVARQSERGEWVERALGDFGGGHAAEKFAEQPEQTVDEGRIRGATELAEARGRASAHDPGPGGAPAHEVGVLALSGREGGEVAGAVDHERQPFLGVVDGAKLIQQTLKFFGESHAVEKW